MTFLACFHRRSKKHSLRSKSVLEYDETIAYEKTDHRTFMKSFNKMIGEYRVILKEFQMFLAVLSGGILLGVMKKMVLVPLLWVATPRARRPNSLAEE